MYFGKVKRFEEKGKLAGKILNQIARGEIINKEQIQKEWLEGSNEIERKYKDRIPVI